MFNAGSIQGKIGLDETPLVNSLKNSEKATEQFKKRAESNLSGSGFFSSLKDQTGKGSGLAQFTKLLAGGGAVVGLGLAANKLEGFSASIAKMADKARAGDLNYKDLVGDALRSIPILGDLTRTFDNLGSAITGSAFALERQVGALREVNAANAGLAGILKSNAAAEKSWQKTNEDLGGKLAVAGAPEGFRGVRQAEVDRDRALSALRDQYQTDAGLIEIEKSRATISRLTSEAQALDRQAADLRRTAQPQGNPLDAWSETNMNKARAAEAEAVKNMQLVQAERTKLAAMEKESERVSAAYETARAAQLKLSTLEIERQYALGKRSGGRAGPNPGVRAEEFFGGKRVVTAADIDSRIVSPAQRGADQKQEKQLEQLHQDLRALLDRTAKQSQLVIETMGGW